MLRVWEHIDSEPSGLLGQLSLVAIFFEITPSPAPLLVLGGRGRGAPVLIGGGEAGREAGGGGGGGTTDG